ncbi:phosphatidate cytidylyltransferase [Sulfitobacter sp. PR48]|jgi:phosphatidate cytidylyltransferase|uniref:phosphatidate cytidylyltransferase n=1 Tax=unclassified Sulfitobacter TaxID=196795 RepID=UPI0022B03F86|nr:MULTISPECIES: phosphatidate cytidylyltransferase [unclassified Sulfitobacter]MCZ4257274.1 phosphatidate cytidylyltransferase [Sulfitobacter sp. G21635-S1]MDD9720436.1 phosphatidate cytidylyltransferase [Sulfitobacter sp. PR48]
MADSFLFLLGCVLAVLLVASAIGQFLKFKAGPDGPDLTIENLNARINAWWVMVGLTALAFSAGNTGVVILFALCSFAALREFLTLTNTRVSDHWAIAAAAFIVLPIQFIAVGMNWYGFYSIFIPVYAFLLMPIVSMLSGETDNFLIRIAEAQWALMISVFCVSHVPALLSLNIADFEGRNLFLIFFLVVVVQSSDVFQYVWGKLLGKHKIAPKVSPSKTWEGLIGGVVTSSLLGASLYWITPFTVMQAVGMSIVITLMGFLGGLVMSAIKRDRGVKDWGHLIAGHGGFIDRLDSVIFSAPIFFHIVRFYWDIH